MSRVSRNTLFSRYLSTLSETFDSGADWIILFDFIYICFVFVLTVISYRFRFNVISCRIRVSRCSNDDDQMPSIDAATRPVSLSKNWFIPVSNCQYKLQRNGLARTYRLDFSSNLNTWSMKMAKIEREKKRDLRVGCKRETIFTLPEGMLLHVAYINFTPKSQFFSHQNWTLR